MRTTPSDDEVHDLEHGIFGLLPPLAAEFATESLELGENHVAVNASIVQLVTN